MKKSLLLGLLLLSQAAFAEDAFTPAVIKQNASLDPATNAAGYAAEVGYVAGVISSIQLVQNAALIPRSICIPATAQTQDIKDALLATSTANIPATNDGGVLYIVSALLAKYPCAQITQ